MMDLTQQEIDERYMRMAIDAAFVAEENGDVPIGTVIVHENRVIARAYNQREQLKDPTAHAEIIALTQAATALGMWRLHGGTIYVTLEPCPMCAGALVQARLDRLVYGCTDPKAGACGTLYDICRDGRLNHRLSVTTGVLAEDCASLLQEFFKKRRRTNGEPAESQ
jgi:tRNA(adenine34) deaminase